MTIERTIAAAVEPIVDDVIALEKRVDELQLQPGPQGEKGEQGRTVPGTEVAAILLCNPEFVKACQGAPGQSVDVKDVALHLAIHHPDILRGAPGKDAEAVEVDYVALARELLNEPDFLPLCKGERGEKGEDGKTPDVYEFIERIFSRHGEALKGAPGRDASAEDCAAILAEKHADVLRGPKGEPGQDGAPGKDGKDGASVNDPVHEAGKIYREGVKVFAYHGQHFEAVRDTHSTPGESEDWKRLGNAGLRFRGHKFDRDTLAEGDIFIDKNSLFLHSGGRSTMMMKGPKDAPHIMGVKIDGADLVLMLSNSKEIRTDVSFLATIIKQQRSIDARMIELEAQHIADGELIKLLEHDIKSLRAAQKKTDAAIKALTEGKAK